MSEQPMRNFNVHLYREMRVEFDGIEAATPEAAAAIAANNPSRDADAITDCDGEDFAALVDLVGDREFSQSVTIDFEAERQRRAAPKLLTALESLADQADEDCPEEHRSRHFKDALEDARATIAEATREHGPITPEASSPPGGKPPAPDKWEMVRHTAASDYGADAYTLWPHGAIVKGVSEADARLIESAPQLQADNAKLRQALDYLLEQTVDMDLKHGISLTEGEADARQQAA